MNLKKVIALILVAVMSMALFAGCGSAPAAEPAPAEAAAPAAEEAAAPAEPATGSLEGKRVRVVIGSTSTGGDSYMMSDIVTRYLGEEMGFNGKVDAVGNAAALDAITNAEGDGTTIMMFHDMTFISVLFGAVGPEYSLENLTIGPRFGQNPGACFGAKADAPFNSLNEAAEWLKANPDKTLSVNIEAGSASHLCFAAFYIWAQDTYGEDVCSRIKAIVGGTTDEKKQRLWDGNADIIYGDYSSFVEFTKEGVDPQLAMKMFDFAGKMEAGFATMADNGITFNGEPFVFNKDFAMYFPKDMDEAVLAEIVAAMQKVDANPDFQAEMAALKYNTVTPEESDLQASRDFINAKNENAKALVAECPSLDDLT